MSSSVLCPLLLPTGVMLLCLAKALSRALFFLPAGCVSLQLMPWHSCTHVALCAHTAAPFPCTLGVRGPIGLSLRFVAAAVGPTGVAEGL